MAGSAAAVFLSSAIALLCLYHLFILPAEPAAPARAHRRSGRHHVSPSSSSSRYININTTPSSSVPDVTAVERRRHPGFPDIEAFRDKLDRLVPEDGWSGLEAELGPLDRYFGPGSPLDVRERLVYLFAILDHHRSPSPNKEGGVGVGELEAWLRRQAGARLEAATRREMGRHDRNGDGHVALSEYTQPGKPLGCWLHKFATADRDGDGSLNAAEFNDFLHPEDSSQEEMQLWILKEKLSYLTVEEARPVIQSLLTGEFSYATAHAKLLMQEADSDRDGKLSLEEMLNDYISFYDIVYVDDHYDSYGVEVDADFHDEL